MISQSLVNAGFSQDTVRVLADRKWLGIVVEILDVLVIRNVVAHGRVARLLEVLGVVRVSFSW